MGPSQGLKLASNARSSLVSFARLLLGEGGRDKMGACRRDERADEVAEDWREVTELLSEEGEDGGLESGVMGMNGAGSPPCSWYSVQSRFHIRSKVDQGAACQVRAPG
jgi:hypothetical protein